MFYATNSGAFLLIGAATTTPLPTPALDTFTIVPLLGSVTPPAYEQTSRFFNVHNDRNRRSLGGRLNDQVIEGNLVIDWDDPSGIHAMMKDDAKLTGGQKRNWKMVYPDAGGRTLVLVGFVSSWKEAPLEAGDESTEHRADFVISIDGPIEEAP